MSETTQTGSNRCKHAGCKCAVPSGQEFCSDHCRQAATQANQGTSPATGQGSCHCGHPACR